MTGRHDLRVFTLQDALGQPAVVTAAPAAEVTATGPNPTRPRHVIDESLKRARQRARIGAVAAAVRVYRAEKAARADGLTCSDEAPELECWDGNCKCSCGIPCTCGGCCGCCTALCGHDYYCESVKPTPTQAEMFARFADMESAPYRFPQMGGSR